MGWSRDRSRQAEPELGFVFRWLVESAHTKPLRGHEGSRTEWRTEPDEDVLSGEACLIPRQALEQELRHGSCYTETEAWALMLLHLSVIVHGPGVGGGGVVIS